MRARHHAVLQQAGAEPRICTTRSAASSTTRRSGRCDEPSRRPAAHPRRPLHPLRILLAEDNLVNQRVAVGLLTKRGHTVTVANDGVEALSALERDAFDLVLMDVQMPEMGGFDATTAIRRRELARRRPYSDRGDDGARDGWRSGALSGGRNGRLHRQADQPGAAFCRCRTRAGSIVEPAVAAAFWAQCPRCPAQKMTAEHAERAENS